MALVLAVLPVSVLCGRTPVEQPIPSPSTATSTPAEASTTVPTRPAAAAPSGREEIDETLRRVFGSALRAEPGPAFPRFFVGDFNADDVEDLAVVALPAPGALPAINDPLAPWIIRDAQRPTPASVSASAAVNGVEQDDVLLAVVHGYGGSAWRSPDARHGYILRHALGEQMRARPAGEVIAVTEPGARAVGDVIAGVIDGRAGFLYWTGTRYLWRRL